MLPTIRVLGHALVDAVPAAAVEAILAPGHRRVAFLNAHCANVAERDPSYRAALASADMVLPDGAGIEVAARLAGRRLSANLNGTDLIPALLAEAAHRGLSVFLLGARPGVAERAARAMRRACPGLEIAGTRHGFGDEEADIAAVAASGADIVLVAKGVPLQDVWLARNAHRLGARIAIGVGALLDFAAGEVPRAPRALRALRGEWIWRLACEPRRMAVRYLVGNPVFLARAMRAAGPEIGRRAFDLLVAGAALAVLALPLLAVALMVRAEDGGPALFRQTRVGRGGRAFTMLKFRSMHVDAESRLAAVRHLSDRDATCFKSRLDPRVTRIGRLLRRASVDELPQLINVLRGEMSVVGPRPSLPSEIAAMPALAGARLSVRPGLTGIWQVSGRAEIGAERMVEMDSAYAASKSLLLDLMIMVLTVRAVVTARGAY